MKSKSVKIKFFSFLLIVGIICTACENRTVMAKTNSVDGHQSSISGNRLIKEILFSTDKMDEKKSDAFKKVIKENGKRYILENVSYDIVDKNPYEIEQKSEKQVDSQPITDGSNYKPKETFEENGVLYTLDHIEQEEKIVAEQYEQKVTGYTDYQKEVSKDSVPQTKNITVKNNQTGENQTVTCNLTDVNKISSSAWEDTYIDIVFESYDAYVFNWNGIKVSKNDSNPLAGYESQLLSSVGANTQEYRVLKTYWIGNAYTNNSGVLCRNARADVQRKANYYRANYSGTIQQPEIKGIIYKSFYNGVAKVVDKNKFVYTIKATATYKESNMMQYILAGVGITILIVLLVLFLFFLSKKNKKEEK